MNEQKNDNVSRRDFIKLTVGWCATLFAFVSSMFACGEFFIPNVLYEPDQRYKALRPEDYAEGATFLPDVRIFLIRKGNSFRAVSAVCTHLGCTVLRNGDNSGFHCPCHGSQYNENAVVTHGPAPKALPWFLVILSRDGRLVIDASQKVNSDKYLVV